MCVGRGCSTCASRRPARRSRRHHLRTAASRRAEWSVAAACFGRRDRRHARRRGKSGRRGGSRRGGAAGAAGRWGGGGGPGRPAGSSRRPAVGLDLEHDVGVVEHQPQPFSPRLTTTVSVCTAMPAAGLARRIVSLYVCARRPARARERCERATADGGTSVRERERAGARARGAAAAAAAAATAAAEAAAAAARRRRRWRPHAGVDVVLHRPLQPPPVERDHLVPHLDRAARRRAALRVNGQDRAVAAAGVHVPAAAAAAGAAAAAAAGDRRRQRHVARAPRTAGRSRAAAARPACWARAARRSAWGRRRRRAATAETAERRRAAGRRRASRRAGARLRRHPPDAQLDLRHLRSHLPVRRGRAAAMVTRRTQLRCWGAAWGPSPVAFAGRSGQPRASRHARGRRTARCGQAGRAPLSTRGGAVAHRGAQRPVECDDLVALLQPGAARRRAALGLIDRSCCRRTPRCRSRARCAAPCTQTRRCGDVDSPCG